MKYVLVDIETDGFNYTKIHCIAAKIYGEEGDPILFTDVRKFNQWCRDNGVLYGAAWVAHNGCHFDYHVLNELTDVRVSPDRTLDTQVLSKLRHYNKFRGHGLKELGEYLKVYKGDYTGSWDTYSSEMGKYCVQDVVVLEEIFKWLQPMWSDPDWQLSIRNEHDSAYLNRELEINGFTFNKTKAEMLLEEVKADMSVLEAGFAKEFPPKLVKMKTNKIRTKEDGTFYANVVRDVATYPKVEFREKEGEYDVYDYKQFNPGSPKDRIDALNDAGWKPFDKTKGHIKAIRERRDLTEYKVYGWKCNEDNLATLPSGASQGVRSLAKWLTLEGRRSSIEEWLGRYNEDTGKIHGKFWNIGAWTQRMSHSAPNFANIPSVFPDRAPKSPVEEIKKKYDGRMRELFEASEGAWLVGTDAEAIQLRVLAHYMESEVYRDAIVSGKQEHGTDIHTVNKKALGTVCVDRDSAKTFIYAWLLGAGLGKIASILKTTTAIAKVSIDKFLASLPELKKIKEIEIPRDAKRGYFIGLDGRKVPCKSEHLMLSGYLQAGEAVIMKMATVIWHRKAKSAGLKFKFVDFVHDEWQTEVYGKKEDAELMGKLQCEALEEVGKILKLFCPLAGKSKIGRNWKETH